MNQTEQSTCRLNAIDAEKRGAIGTLEHGKKDRSAESAFSLKIHPKINLKANGLASKIGCPKLENLLVIHLMANIFEKMFLILVLMGAGKVKMELVGI